MQVLSGIIVLSRILLARMFLAKEAERNEKDFLSEVISTRGPLQCWNDPHGLNRQVYDPFSYVLSCDYELIVNQSCMLVYNIAKNIHLREGRGS